MDMRLDQIGLDDLACLVDSPELVERHRVPELCGLLEIDDRLLRLGSLDPAVAVGEGERVERSDMALFCRLPIHLDGPRFVDLGAKPLRQHPRAVEHGVGLALFRRAADQLVRGRVILQHALAAKMHQAEAVHRLGAAGVGGCEVEHPRILEIRLDADPEFGHPGEIEARIRLTRLERRPEARDRIVEPPLFERREAILQGGGMQWQSGAGESGGENEKLQRRRVTHCHQS